MCSFCCCNLMPMVVNKSRQKWLHGTSSSLVSFPEQLYMVYENMVGLVCLDYLCRWSEAQQKHLRTWLITAEYFWIKGYCIYKKWKTMGLSIIQTHPIFWFKYSWNQVRKGNFILCLKRIKRKPGKISITYCYYNYSSMNCRWTLIKYSIICRIILVRC